MKNSITTQSNSQYSLAQILGIWAAAAVPMGLLAWVVFPALAPRVNLHPGIFLWVLMIIGLMWQVVLSFAILYREESTLNLSAIRYRTWRHDLWQRTFVGGRTRHAGRGGHLRSSHPHSKTWRAPC